MSLKWWYHYDKYLQFSTFSILLSSYFFNLKSFPTHNYFSKFFCILKKNPLPTSTPLCRFLSLLWTEISAYLPNLHTQGFIMLPIWHCSQWSGVFMYGFVSLHQTVPTGWSVFKHLCMPLPFHSVPWDFRDGLTCFNLFPFVPKHIHSKILLQSRNVRNDLRIEKH